MSDVGRCTWKDCQAAAAHPQVARDGEVWANLCDGHNAEIEKAITALDAKATLRCWVLASGGAAKMTERMMR